MTETTKNPSAYQDVTGHFTFETNAYTSNNQYALMGIVNEWGHVRYYNYGFDLAGFVIDQVEVTLEHKSGHGTPAEPPDEALIRVSNDGGIHWGSWHQVTLMIKETAQTVDVTSDFAWTPDMLSNANFKIELKVAISATGCYAPNTYFAGKTADGKGKRLIPIEELKKGDLAMMWTEEKGLHYNPIFSVTPHNKLWTLIDIWSGEVDLPNLKSPGEIRKWHSHLTVTNEQPKWVLCWDLVSGKWVGHQEKMSAQELYDRYVEKRKMKDPRYDEVAHLWYDGKWKYFPCYRITTRKYMGIAYDVQGDPVTKPFLLAKTLTNSEMATLESFGYSLEKQVELGPPFMVIIVKTYYLDWIPVKVTYHTPAPSRPQRMLIGVGK